MTPDQKEELRHVALEALARRHPAALPLRALRRLAAREVFFGFTEGDLAGALELLVGLGYVRAHPDELGSTLFYQATPQGVLFRERRQEIQRTNPLPSDLPSVTLNRKPKRKWKETKHHDDD